MKRYLLNICVIRLGVVYLYFISGFFVIIISQINSFIFLSKFNHAATSAILQAEIYLFYSGYYISIRLFCRYLRFITFWYCKDPQFKRFRFESGCGRNFYTELPDDRFADWWPFLGYFWRQKGRLSVLFGSILVYSLANIACGFLPYFPKTNLVYTYALLRFVAGVGLAGELGAGITLVSESLPKELRAIGTSVVAGFGLMGAVVAQLTVELSGGWNISYIIGGGLGILLLFLRISVSESGIYKNIKHQSVSKGNFLSFLPIRQAYKISEMYSCRTANLVLYRYFGCIGQSIRTRVGN